MVETDYEIYSFIGFAEPVSSLLHLIGATVFLYLGIKMCVNYNGNRINRSGLIIFAFGTVFMLSMSGVYHLLDQGGTGRYVLQHLDHAAIWIMIAGTFTPIHLILFKGWKRWAILLLIWTVAINGVVLKTIFFDSFPEWLGLILYLGMGWVGLYSGILISKDYDMDFIKPLMYGGIAYSVGAILEFMRAPELIPGVIGPHELFHIAIIFGVVYHWRFVSEIILLFDNRPVEENE
jgi:channel protein (hemolysin III family)